VGVQFYLDRSRKTRYLRPSTGSRFQGRIFGFCPFS
jgi:hypothetical protein